MVQLSYSYMTTVKTIALTIQIFVSKRTSLLFNTLSRFIIVFLPRSKCLLISWLHSPFTVILESKKIRAVAVSIFSPSICHVVLGLDAMILVFWILNFKPVFPLSSFTFIKRLFSSSSFSAIRVRLLIFLLAILIPACVSSSQAFSRTYSAYKLKKYGDDIQPWRMPISILNQSVLCSKFSLIIYFVHNINSAGVAFYDYIFFLAQLFLINSFLDGILLLSYITSSFLCLFPDFPTLFCFIGYLISCHSCCLFPC